MPEKVIFSESISVTCISQKYKKFYQYDRKIFLHGFSETEEYFFRFREPAFFSAEIYKILNPMAAGIIIALINDKDRTAKEDR